MIFKVVNIFFLTTIIIITESKPSFEFGEPTYFGNGCTTGSLKIVPAADGKSWSVLFSDFIAETDGYDIFDRKTCNMAVTLEIKKNKKIGVFKTEYRGYTYGPSSKSSSYSSLDAEWFFVGDRGEEKSIEYKSDRDDFHIVNHVKEKDVEYCGCGASTIFRINTAIAASKEKASDPDLEIGIDTIDQTSSKSSVGGFTFYIYEQDC